MSDTEIAYIARRLADALRKVARERDQESKKEVARLQTELCQAVREETPDNSGTSEVPAPS